MFHFPKKPKALHLLELAKPRTTLTPEETLQFERLSRGYKGEKLFAELLKGELQRDCIPLFGIQINVSGSECQFDCLLIFQHGMYLFEIKYHQGDYYVDGDQWFSLATKREIRNPVFQLRRSSLLLKEFLAKNKITLSTDAHLVFNHPQFYLYQAPTDIPLIFSGQQQRLMRQLNQIPSQLHEWHHQLAETLKAAHIHESKNEHLPTFEYHRLKKGIVCQNCGGFMNVASQRLFSCSNCHQREPVEAAIVRMVKEYCFLFPGKSITVQHIKHWINALSTESSIRRHLNKHFTKVESGNGTYYLP